MIKETLRAWNRARKDRRMHARAPRDTPHGFKFVGPETMQSGQFEIEETAWLKPQFESADLFVNIGANFGYYACMAASTGLQTIAVEPVPSNFRLLSKNIDLNGFAPRIDAKQIACGSERGQIEIFGVGSGASVVPGWANNPSALKSVVDVVPFDEVLRDVPAQTRILVLCDVEGFEKDVLLGAEETMRARKGDMVWLIESGLTDHRASDALHEGFLDVFDLVTSYGYNMFSLSALETPIARSQITDSLAQGVDLIGVHNFVMTARAES